MPAGLDRGRGDAGDGHAARNVERALAGKPPLPFRYRDKGMLATIGRAAGVADVRGLRFSGLTAWLLWLFVHIFFLIGFRNRVAVVLQWGWSYLTWRRGARLITDTAELWRFIADQRQAPPPDDAGAGRERALAPPPEQPAPL